MNVAWWLLPSRLRQHLLAFQWDGLVYALQRGGRVIIGDEMGLGKTVQAIACIAVYRQFPCLIVVRLFAYPLPLVLMALLQVIEYHNLSFSSTAPKKAREGWA